MNLRLITVLFFSLASGVSNAQLPGSLRLVPQGEPIPHDFKTYSLFLICNPGWLTAGGQEDLSNLYSQFQAFGRAIGDDNLAVWFFDPADGGHGDPSRAQVVDVERSVRYCRAWRLTPSEGPHLVITSSYPDEANLSATLSADRAVYGLGGMAPEDISLLLARLTDQLILNGKVEPSTARSTLQSSSSSAAARSTLWVRLLSATQQTLHSFGCAWSFKIETGPVTADLKSCEVH